MLQRIGCTTLDYFEANVSLDCFTPKKAQKTSQYTRNPILDNIGKIVHRTIKKRNDFCFGRRIMKLSNERRAYLISIWCSIYAYRALKHTP